MKRILILLASLAPFFVKGQGGAYTIYGKTDLPINGAVYLNWYNLNSGKHTDSTIAVHGNFEFKGTIAQIETGQIIFRSGRSDKSIVFYLEPGNIEIDWPAGTRYAKLAGTPTNNDFQQYYELLDGMLNEVNKNRAGQPEYTQFSKEIQPQSLSILKAFTKTHPASRVTLERLNLYSIKNTNPSAVSAILAQLSSALRKSVMGMEIASRIKGMGAAKVGDMALGFALPDTSGRMVKLSDFKGKYVLLDFWATWCGPCIAEMPNVIKAYQEYKDKNFTIVGVSLDRPDSKLKWLNMIKTSGYNWTQLSDLKFWNSEAALLYNINAVPANFLIDPQGKIIAVNLRGKDLQDKLATALK